MVAVARLQRLIGSQGDEHDPECVKECGAVLALGLALVVP